MRKFSWSQRITWAVASVVLAACGNATTTTTAGSDDAIADTAVDVAGDVTSLTTVFPKGFLWGAAIAGFQVDMGCPTLPAAKCDDTQSDWYQWITDPAIKAETIAYLAGDPPSAGPGFWETWPAYLDAARDTTHLGALRMSIEWSRLFPDGAAEKAKTVEELKAYVNKDAVAAYHAMFQGAKARGMTLLVTLNHYTLPLWLHDGKDCHFNGLDPVDGCKNRGWVDKDRMLNAIALYSGYCAAEFGAEVDLWGTLNEPFAVVLAGYILPNATRSNPPGLVLQLDAAIGVMFNMMEGHARMYDAVHENDKVDADQDGKAAQVGIVSNLVYIVPADPQNPAHVTSAKHADWVYNQAFLEATINGEVDRDLDGVPEEHRPDMKGRMDFIGVNYYNILPVNSNPIPGADKWKFLDFQPDLNSFGSNPEGLYHELKFAAQYKLPIYITENGTSEPKETGIGNFVQPHLQWLHKAIAEGVDVRGYFYWSLMDNYEWNHGMNEMKFGLFSFDPAKKTPVVTPMATGYGAITSGNGW